MNKNLAPRVEHWSIVKKLAELVIRNSHTQKCREIERANGYNESETMDEKLSSRRIH